MNTKHRTSSRPRAVYLLPLGTIIVLGGLSLLNLGRIRTSQRDMVQSQQLLLSLKDLTTHLISAETGYRGYLLTGETSYLEPYHRSRFAIRSTLQSIKKQHQEQAKFQPQHARLTQLIDEKLKDFAETIALYDEANVDSAIARVQSDQSNEILEEIRSIIDSLEQSRAQRLREYESQASSAYFTAILTAVFALLLTLAAIIWALLQVDHELMRRTQAELSTSQRLRQLRSLTDTISRISAARDVYSVFGIALNEYRQLMGAREAIACIKEAGEVHYETSLLSSVEPRDGDVFHQAAFKIAAQAAEDESAFFRSRQDLESNPNVTQLPEWITYQSQISGLLSVPMVTSSRHKLGRLLLLSKFDSEFDDGDLSVSLQLAHGVAVAVENTRLTEAMERAARRKDEFLAMLGHELRNPLAGILTGSEALCHAGMSDQQDDEMRRLIHRQAQAMNDIVDDLLDVSRIARGKIALVLTRHEFAEAVTEIVNDFKSVHPDREFRLNIDSRDQGYPVVMDRTRIGQCLTNLLQNACKFSTNLNPVEIELSVLATDPNLLQLCVIDHGIGLNSRELEEVFDLFCQVNTTIDRGAGGLGLGLTLAKGVIEMHRGSIHAESAGRNRGATFCIRLPLAKEQAREQADNQGDGAAPQARWSKASAPDDSLDPTSSRDQNGQLRILTIDDRPDARLPIKVLLSKEGHHVLEADTAEVGIEIANRQRPDVIFCDIGLPGELNGYDVVRKLRSNPSLQEIYIVALSGYSQESDRVNAANAGFDFHVAKPVGYDMLRELIYQRPCFPKRPPL